MWEAHILPRKVSRRLLGPGGSNEAKVQCERPPRPILPSPAASRHPLPEGEGRREKRFPSLKNACKPRSAWISGDSPNVLGQVCLTRRGIRFISQIGQC